MARRELTRAVSFTRLRVDLAFALAGAAALTLAIPLHRSVEAADAPRGTTYLAVLAVVIQLGIIGQSAIATRSRWHRDMSSGSAEELAMTGAAPSQLLLGIWLGACGAAAASILTLLPVLVLTLAVTGASASVMAPVLLSWWLSAAAGSVLGLILASTERQGLNGSPVAWRFWILLILAWGSYRSLFSTFGGSGWALELLRIFRSADPLLLVPAAAGAVGEPWVPKAAAALLAIAGTVAWIGSSPRRFDWGEPPKASASFDGLMLLRPVRRWVAAHRQAQPPCYDRDLAYRFERAHGWRLRISTAGWLMLLAILLIPALPVALLGPGARSGAWLLLMLPPVGSALIAGIGTAAALAAERELSRWPGLLSTPLRTRDWLLAKCRAACTESAPLWAAAAFQAALFAVAGVLDWSAVAVAGLSAPLAAGVTAAWTAAFCVSARSLATATQRAVILLLVPPVVVELARWLLPGGEALESLSLFHLLAEAHRHGLHSGGLPLVVSTAHAASASLCLAAAVWQLERDSLE
ncbi:MAG: hypothetical protein ACK47B_15725 [Armatimonadota bacterium]